MTFDALQLQARQSTTRAMGCLLIRRVKRCAVCYQPASRFLCLYFLVLLLGPGGALFCFLQRHYERARSNGGANPNSLDATVAWARRRLALVGRVEFRVSLLLLALVGRFRDGWPFFVASLKDWSIDEGDLLYAGVCLGLAPEVEPETELDSAGVFGLASGF